MPGVKKVWWYGYGESFRRQMDGFLDMQFARRLGSVGCAAPCARPALCAESYESRHPPLPGLQLHLHAVAMARGCANHQQLERARDGLRIW